MSAFNKGDKVKDISTGRVGVVLSEHQNRIIPNLEQFLVVFADNSSDLLYKTRLKLVSAAEVSDDVEAILAEIEEDLAAEEIVAAVKADDVDETD